MIPMNKKPSFFERLSGSSASGDSFDAFDEELTTAATPRARRRALKQAP